ERRLPVNTSLSDLRLDDAQERARLARVFEQGLTSVVGYVLPIEHVGDTSQGNHWRTREGPLRSERVLLIPGDSPLGCRLPIEGLPGISSELRKKIYEIDPFGNLPPLPAVQRLQQPGTRAPWGYESPRGGAGEDGPLGDPRLSGLAGDGAGGRLGRRPPAD